MRKIFSTILAIFFVAANFSIGQAAAVRLADTNAESLLGVINTVLSFDTIQQKAAVVTTNLQRVDNAELAQQGMNGLGCQYGVKNSSTPKGEILFVTDSQGYVVAMKITNYGNDDTTAMGLVMAATFFSLGMNENEMDQILNNFKEEGALGSSSAWCSAKNRNIVMITNGGANAQAVLVASDQRG